MNVNAYIDIPAGAISGQFIFLTVFILLFVVLCLRKKGHRYLNKRTAIVAGVAYFVLLFGGYILPTELKLAVVFAGVLLYVVHMIRNSAKRG